jgi:hypothetical protein
MPYYIPATVSKNTCIGNTLSTFNASFTSLDSRLYELSTYTVNSVNFLSSTMISVSSVLDSRVNFLSSAVNYVSANVVNDYIRQGVLVNVAGQINWDFSTVGTNAKIDLFSNANLNNPTGLSAGQTGNLIVKIGTVNRTISSFGNRWTFVSLASTLNTTLSAKNVISYYYDGEQLLSSLISFSV